MWIPPAAPRTRQANFEGNDTGAQLSVETGARVEIHCSDFSQNAVAGLEFAQGDTVETTSNFWGDDFGPTHPLNGAGTGDSVIDSANGGRGMVDHADFLAQAATVDDCACGLPAPFSVPLIGAGGRAMSLLGVLPFALVALQARLVPPGSKTQHA